MMMEQHPFIELIERHNAAIERVCRSFCSSPEDREDLKQEILVHLWQGWKGYRPEHKPITWLYRVALNTAISWRRSQKRRVETMPLEAFDVPEDATLQELSAHLRALMLRLPVADQRLLSLYLDGFSSAEIGEMMQMSTTAVTTRIGRIKEKLRKMNEK